MFKKSHLQRAFAACAQLLAACSAWCANAPAASQADTGSLFIKEIRVNGAHHLPPIEVEDAVYPFVGPGRTRDDVEKARAALEKAYRDKGFQTVAVQIPRQQGKGGIIYLKVLEGTVERLRVQGARYSSPAAIKALAPSLAEGKVVDFNQVPHDIVALNQSPDRRVTPVLRAGTEPGSVDIDLNVKDSSPVHGSLELNNRYSANTTPLRINGAISDSDFAQLGHSVGVSFQIAPQRLADAKVVSGYYLARLPATGWLSLMAQGTKQDSNVSTLGGADVAGRGESLGVRAIAELPSSAGFYQSFNTGIDYKHFDQDILVANGKLAAPITYFPMTALYTASLSGHGATTEFNGGVTFNLRGPGSDTEAFDTRRYQSDGSFIYFRGDLSHTHDLPGSFQIFGKLQGQLSDNPLIDSEEFSGGGLGTVRGYLESEVVGDDALFGSVELRSPNFSNLLGPKVNEWRIYAFSDAGALIASDPLPEQKSRFSLASYGVGSRFRFEDHFNGSLDAAIPLISQSSTKANDARLTFRLWSEF